LADEKKAGGKRGTAKGSAGAAKGSKARTASKSKASGGASAKPKAGSAKAKAPKPARRVSLPPPSDANTRRREEAKKLAIAVAVAALDKKAERVEIVDIGEKVDYADYLVVMTGRSDRQVLAIAQGIEESIQKSAGIRTRGREGLPAGHWVLMDLGDVIVHIFLDEARKYYDLEGLWMDAPRVPTPSFVPPNVGTGPTE
jgi:ribosome-associated protein